MATIGHSTSSPNLHEFVRPNKSTVQIPTDFSQGIKEEETNFCPNSEATFLGKLLSSFWVYKTVVLQAKSWWTVLQKWVKSLISKDCPALGQDNKELREKIKMADCYPDVREGLPTSGRECFTMGTAFLSPLHTAGGGCCTHKQDGPVPVEAEDLFGQFDESENTYQDLFASGNMF